ncbi:DinB family protein [Prosthecochloris sp. GSB1]|uniref:DinB family protein n=1 Tax=Prosthecochloris sp. GSB1 TaxID=281093 RepID=UPI00142E3568|nr:DinB family protein [Prosthecochloris sp. GSB1]
MNWKELLNDEIHYTYGVTDHLVGMVRDDELDWKPDHGYNWMSMGQLLMHISDACGSTFEGLIRGAWDIREEIPPGELEPRQLFPSAGQLPRVESVAEARKLLHDDRKLALRSLKKCSEEDLSAKYAPAPWTMNPMVLGQRLLHMVFHLNQHKGQLYYYLKMTGRQVDTCDLFGMSCRFDSGDQIEEEKKNPYSI